MMLISPSAVSVASLSLVCLAVYQILYVSAFSQNSKKISQVPGKTLPVPSSPHVSKTRFNDDEDELTYQYGVNTRSTGDELASDSCHLSIECDG